MPPPPLPLPHPPCPPRLPPIAPPTRRCSSLGQERGASPTRPSTAHGFNFLARSNFSFFSPTSSFHPPSPFLWSPLVLQGRSGGGEGLLQRKSGHVSTFSCLTLLYFPFTRLVARSCYIEIFSVFWRRACSALSPSFPSRYSPHPPTPPKPLAGLVFANPAASPPHVGHFGIINHQRWPGFFCFCCLADFHTEPK